MADFQRTELTSRGDCLCRKLDQKLKETTFVHQLFGGRLRSRVHCLACEHNSDTFDSFLDLSLDVGREAQSVQQALNVLTRKDKLTGSNKYKCEKCVVPFLSPPILNRAQRSRIIGHAN